MLKERSFIFFFFLFLFRKVSFLWDSFLWSVICLLYGKQKFTYSLPTTTLYSEHRKIVSYTYCLSLRKSLILHVSVILIHHSQTFPECLACAKGLHRRLQRWIDPYNYGLCTVEITFSDCPPFQTLSRCLTSCNLIFKTPLSIRHQDSYS